MYQKIAGWNDDPKSDQELGKETWKWPEYLLRSWAPAGFKRLWYQVSECIGEKGLEKRPGKEAWRRGLKKGPSGKNRE